MRIINNIIIFLLYFPLPSRPFYGFRENFLRNFQKIAIKKQSDEVYILLRHMSQELGCFPGDFLEFLEEKSVEQLR